MGKGLYPKMKEFMITADGGGSNSSGSSLWKRELQQLANELAVVIHVCHFPPGTSKWNKIEHQLFNRITGNWKGKPLTSHEVIMNLISSTKTDTGLTVRCVLDTNEYPLKQKVLDEEIELFNIKKNKFRGEWNYIISPQINQRRGSST